MQRTIEKEIVTSLAFHLNREPQVGEVEIAFDFDKTKGVVIQTSRCNLMLTLGGTYAGGTFTSTKRVSIP